MVLSGTRKRLTFLIVPFGLVCLLSLPGFLAFWPNRTHLQTIQSPDNDHIAKLLRMDAIDRNYIVYIDGTRVYVSPDFAPRRDLPYREMLVWDKSGHILVLKIAGQRIFGYDADSLRRLLDDELLAVKLKPDPPLWEYYYESEWPGIGRVRRPKALSKQNANQ